MKKIFIILFFFVLVTGLYVQNGQATTLYVTTTGAGLNDGTSWDNAFVGLQAALTAAQSGDEIWVAKGTYKPSSAYDLTNTSRYYHFRMINGVAIYGGFAGTESATSERLNYAAGEVNETILSGDIGVEGNNTDNCYHVFYNPDGLGLTSSAILDGLTISGGNANSGNPHNLGGGVYNYTSSPTFTNCTFSSNSASSGAGVYNSSSSPTFINCTFSSNSASGGSTPSGGGMRNNTSSSPTLTNCTFSSNNANYYGGGLSNYSSSPTLTNCTFTSNYAGHAGGGLYNYLSSVNLSNCIFLLNSTQIGGGMFHRSASSATLNNCTFSSNSASLDAGGISNESSSSIVFNNCIIWGNVAAGYGNQFYSNTVDGTITLNYSCYENDSNDVHISFGTFTATNNCITTDPLFVDANENDFRIVGISPCADAGDDSYNSESFDIRGTGFSRKLDNAGGVGTIDIGAYEYQFGVDPLPVELISYTASVTNNSVILSWQTATEVNNYGFEIERAMMNDELLMMNWSKVRFVEGNGTTHAPKEYSYTDNVTQSGKYSYRLKQIDRDGKFTYSQSVEVEIGTTPTVFAMEQNYPNPFNPTTTIAFTIAQNGPTTLKIFNTLGQEVATLVNENLNAGEYHKATFNASRLASGIYFAQLRNGNEVQLKKLMLLK